MQNLIISSPSLHPLKLFNYEYNLTFDLHIHLNEMPFYYEIEPFCRGCVGIISSNEENSRFEFDKLLKKRKELLGKGIEEN